MMTRDYANTVIYKFIHNCSNTCNNCCNTYVGLTTNYKDRIRVHKRVTTNPANKSYTMKMYETIRMLGGWNNFTFYIIEEYPCRTFQEARQREKFWIDTIKPSLNTNK